MILMILGIMGVCGAVCISGTNTNDCRTLWDVHQKYMKYALTAIVMVVSLVVYFIGLMMRGV